MGSKPKKGTGKKNREKLNAFLEEGHKKAEHAREVKSVYELMQEEYMRGYTKATTLFLYILHHYYGFGADREEFILNLLEDFVNTYYLPNGEVSLEDMQQILREECNIDIDFTKHEVVNKEYWNSGEAISIASAGKGRTRKKG